MKKVDVIFVELQDCGMRHYTYFPTIYKFLEVAAAHNKPIVVFDRVNPLGGLMEGPLVDDPFISFVSIASYPLRHGMTVGELALYCNDVVLKKRANLQVVPMANYNRFQQYPLLSPLSPNIQTLRACSGYSFLGMLGEIRLSQATKKNMQNSRLLVPINIGIGSENAFSMVGVDKTLYSNMSFWYRLKNLLQQRGIQTKGLMLYDERRQQNIRGISFCLSSMISVPSFELFLLLANQLQKAGFVIDFKPIFDKVAGIEEVRKYLQGVVSYKELSNKVNGQLQEFYEKAKPYFLYEPRPQLHLLNIEKEPIF
jgi:uncharacterized protein YbbC (DUF1343 family)